MNGNKKYFIKGNKFYKEYTKQEFLFLKCLHGEHEQEFPIDILMIDGVQYIEMLEGNVISIDTIKKEDRNDISIRNIIINNIPFILKQISLLNRLNIYYSDQLQFVLINHKLYLIDFDAAEYKIINHDYDNYTLLAIYLRTFNIDSTFITKGLIMYEALRKQNYLTLDKTIRELHKKYFYELMIPNYLYYSQNNRYCQLNINNTQIPASEIDNKIKGNYVYVDTFLTPSEVEEWELIKIY